MTHRVIDAVTGQPFAHGEGVVATLQRAANMCGRYNPTTRAMHLDAQGFDRYRSRMDAASIVRMDSMHGRPNVRRDNQAGGFPRDFEYIYEEDLAEPRRPLNSEKLFVVDGRVPVGAPSHTVRRSFGSGDAALFRGGMEFPVVRGSGVEETFGVAHFVTSATVDYFEMASQTFAGRANFTDDMRTGVRAIRERMNACAFVGVPEMKVYGVTNYPHLETGVSTFTFTRAAIAADPTGCWTELDRLANHAIEVSGGVFRPNRVATSIRVHNAIMGARSASIEKSIGAMWLEGQAEINQIEAAQELQGIGPNGEDGILFYDDQRESLANVVILPPTSLPMHALSAMENQVVLIGSVGGVVMRNSGNNHLGLVVAA